jgi:hypothetical protein
MSTDRNHKHSAPPPDELFAIKERHECMFGEAFVCFNVLYREWA